MSRPVEDYVLDLMERREATAICLDELPTDFEAFLVLLRAIGWRPGELAQMLGVHGRGYTRQNISRVTNKVLG